MLAIISLLYFTERLVYFQWTCYSESTCKLTSVFLYMSCHLKLGMYAPEDPRGAPPSTPRTLYTPFSELRDPILIFFFVKTSRWVGLDENIFLGFFGSPWSFDPERLRQTRCYSRCCLKKNFIVILTVYGRSGVRKMKFSDRVWHSDTQIPPG